jgi:hypothetical protein
VAFQYSAEVFPTIQREQGMAWAVCINNTFGKSAKTRTMHVLSLTDFGSWYSELDFPSYEDGHDSHWSL